MPSICQHFQLVEVPVPAALRLGEAASGERGTAVGEEGFAIGKWAHAVGEGGFAIGKWTHAVGKCIPEAAGSILGARSVPGCPIHGIFANQVQLPPRRRTPLSIRPAK